MNSFQTDENNDEILISKDNQQVMMEWEKPYMEQSIDFLNPKGDVLEIGFGCGYSATQFLKHSIKSYTVIECDPVVIKKIEEWAKNYPTTPIYIIEGRWQENLFTLDQFDEIYFDDYPLDISKDSENTEILLSNKRINIFLDQCIQNHTKVGSKICCYLNGNSKITLPSDTEPFVKVEYKNVDIDIPKNCEYRDLKEQKCLIPVITKVKEYDFEEASRFAMVQISKHLKL